MITYQDRISSFEVLVKTFISVSIHDRNMQYLLVKIHKVKMELSPSIMNDITFLNQNFSCNLRAGVTVTRRNVRRNKFGFETVSTSGSMTWGKIPSDLKNASRLFF